MTTIEDNNIYKHEMDSFKSKLKCLFPGRGESFLTKEAVSGDNKTFYIHCFRCYIPKLSWTTFSDHHLSVQVFIMQGYECRKNEIKTVLAYHCNVKANVQKQTVNRLFDEYYFLSQIITF